MKHFIRQKLRNLLLPVLHEVLGQDFAQRAGRIDTLDRITQLRLMLEYQRMARQGEPLPSFADTQFRSFSQNGEDGILLYIFSLIGMTNRRALEICCGDGIECNATNLIVNHGFDGLLIDGNEQLLHRGRAFYRRCRETMVYPPKLVQAWIEAETINDLLADHGFEGEIDLFSLDMDGVDYWIWKSIEVVKPRVVVLEYQDIIGPERRLTVPYRRDFQAEYVDGAPDYAGASLAAFAELAAE